MSGREINLDFKGMKAEIIYHQFHGLKVKTLLVSFADKRKSLSTREGFKEVTFVANHYSPPGLWDFIHKNKEEYEEKLYADLGIVPDAVAMLFTGADMDNLSIKMEEYDDFKVYACVTAGVKSNAQRIGVDKAGNIEKEGGFKPLATVNIIILTNARLSDAAMVGSIITITEAKVIAFQDMDIRSSYNSKIQATGTGTDNIIVVRGFDTRITYLGGHAKAGEMMAKAVTCAVKEAIFKQKVLLRNREKGGKKR
jgi:adenosylcobinamide amidohydrolase